MTPNNQTGTAWRGCRPAQRGLTWLYRGVRWRVVGLGRKVAWAYRGVRWRVVGLGRKVAWIYRGVRWRAIGRYRKLRWFIRRRRVDLERVLKMSRRSLLRARSSVLGRRRVLGIRARHIATPSRQLARDLVDRPFDDLLQAIGVSTPEGRLRSRLGRARVRRRIFDLPPTATTPTVQVVEIPTDVRRRAVAALVGPARIVRVRSTTDDAQVQRLASMASGRPALCEPCHDRERPVELDDMRRRDDHELRCIANDQLRRRVLSAISVPTISVVLSTNRAEYVESALQQMAAQQHVRLEVLVGCHGFLPADLSQQPTTGGAIASLTLTAFDESVVFGEVLGELSSSATADWILKWDDDDLYGPNHVTDLWIGAVLSGSVLVGKAAEFVLLSERGLLVRRRGGSPNRATRFLAGGTLLMSRAALEAVGGWGALPRSVDQDLIARFERHGFLPWRIHGYEFVLVRHGRGHTWAADAEYFERAADEIRGAAALSIAAVPAPQARAASDRRPALASMSVCVPNKDGLASVRLWEERSASIATEVVIADDRSDPPLRTRRVS